MFKRLAERILPSRSRPINRISIEHGGILAQTDCESILFFMLPSLEWSDGLNGEILNKAGPELDEYILTHVARKHSGEVYAIPPFNTGLKKMFVAILAHWDGGNGFEERDLMNCYRRALAQALEMGITSIAIPSLGRDKRDFPHIRFARVALKAIVESMDSTIEQVSIYCLDRRTYETYRAQMNKLRKKL